MAIALGGCLGNGGAVSVRWRIAERDSGDLADPRDVHDVHGVCCPATGPDGACCVLSNDSDQCCAAADEATGCRKTWHVTRVRVVLADPETGGEVPQAASGLDAACSARELTTPFELPLGLFAITLRAFDPAAPGEVEAESPSPEIRTVRKAEIVSLDVVQLSVSR